jgi:DNA-binding transcriptional regulator YiaG
MQNEPLDELVRVRAMTTTGHARALRRAAGLSIGEVAHVVGVAPSTIYRWETARRRPRGDAARRYLHLLDGLTDR